MAKVNLQAALAAFQLGAKLQELQFWIENAWWEDDQCEPVGIPRLGLQRLGAEIERIQGLINRLVGHLNSPPPRRKLEELLEQLADYWSAFCAELQNPVREQCLSVVRDAGPEAAEDVYHYQVAHSPLNAPAWTPVADILKELPATLDLTLRECFEFASYAYSKLCPVAKLLDPTEGGRRAVETADVINDRLQRLQAILPWVIGVEPFRSTVNDIFVEIRRIAEAVENGLQNPQAIPLYLGLVLNADLGEVTRGKLAVKVPNGVQWSLLEILAGARQNFSPRGNLEAAWEQVGRRQPDEYAFSQMLSGLRRRLGELKIDLQMRRQVGWRLRDAADRKK